MEIKRQYQTAELSGTGKQPDSPDNQEKTKHGARIKRGRKRV